MAWGGVISPCESLRDVRQGLTSHTDGDILPRASNTMRSERKQLKQRNDCLQAVLNKDTVYLQNAQNALKKKKKRPKVDIEPGADRTAAP